MCVFFLTLLPPAEHMQVGFSSLVFLCFCAHCVLLIRNVSAQGGIALLPELPPWRKHLHWKQIPIQTILAPPLNKPTEIVQSHAFVFERAVIAYFVLRDGTNAIARIPHVSNGCGDGRPPNGNVAVDRMPINDVRMRKPNECAGKRKNWQVSSPPKKKVRGHAAKDFLEKCAIDRVAGRPQHLADEPIGDTVGAIVEKPCNGYLIANVNTVHGWNKSVFQARVTRTALTSSMKTEFSIAGLGRSVGRVDLWPKIPFLMSGSIDNTPYRMIFFVQFKITHAHGDSALFFTRTSIGGLLMPIRRPLPVLRPDRVRGQPRSFAWIDHRLRSEGWLSRLSSTEIDLYLFLALAADAQGLSCWRLDRIERELPEWDVNRLRRARERLTAEDLLAFRSWSPGSIDGSYQLLTIPPCASKPARGGTSMRLGECLASMRLNAPSA